MSDPQKLSFGSSTPGTSGSTGSSLFGTANNSANKTTGTLFGSGSTAGGGTGFSFGNFGNSPAASSGGEQKSIFGSTAASSSGNMFGGQQSGPEDERPATTSSPFGPFGQNLSTPGKSSAPTSSGLFDASTGTGASQPLFGNPTTSVGSSTPAPATSAPSFSFGPSTTPAGPPPTNNAFGGSTGGGGGGGGIFNLGGTPGQQPQFGSNPLSQPQPATTSFQPSNTSGLFAAPQSVQSGPGLFGTPKPAQSGFPAFSQPAQPSAEASNQGAANGGASQPFQGFNLGQSPNVQSSSAPTSSIFGNVPPPSAKPTPPLFSHPASTATSSTPKATFSFGGQAPTSLASINPPASVPSEPAKPLFGGLGTPAASQPQSTAPPTTASLFGATNGHTPATGGPTPPTSTSQAGPSFFSGLGSTTTSSSQPATTSTAAAPNVNTNTAPAALGLGASILGTSTAGPVPPTQSRLRNKTMDEILTRWASDLTKYTKEFKTHAETVAQWDQILVDNMSKISKLYSQTAISEKQTASVEMQLTAVESQQDELDSWLTKYENEVEEMLAKNSATQNELGGPDQDRERTYKLAEKLGERLEDMSRDLESMIEEINAANSSLSKHTKADEPITQIVRILNSHLTQLQAIDQGTVALQAKVAAAQKNAGSLGYMNGAGTGGGAAVEDFYRSFMGRR